MIAVYAHAQAELPALDRHIPNFRRSMFGHDAASYGVGPA